MLVAFCPILYGTCLQVIKSIINILVLCIADTIFVSTICIQYSYITTIKLFAFSIRTSLLFR